MTQPKSPTKDDALRCFRYLLFKFRVGIFQLSVSCANNRNSETHYHRSLRFYPRSSAQCGGTWLTCRMRLSAALISFLNRLVSPLVLTIA